MTPDAIIREHVIWACAAGAVPVPLVDFAAVTAIQLDMLKKLAAHHGIPYSETKGRSWLTALSGSIFARLGGNMLKLVPGIGSVLGGVSMSMMSGASTYALGQVATRHFAQDGTFEDLDLERAQADFKAAYDEGKAVAQAARQSDEALPNERPLDTLERLGALHQSGVLTDDEFARKKAELLARI